MPADSNRCPFGYYNGDVGISRLEEQP